MDQAADERHIRCLGLAILLAKAEAVGAPLIILDDAINGIAALIQLDDRMRISGKDADRQPTLVSAGNKVVLALKEIGPRRSHPRRAIAVYRPGTCLRCCRRRGQEAKRGELASTDAEGQRFPLAPDKVATQEAS